MFSWTSGPNFVFVPLPSDGLQAFSHEDYLQPSHRQAGVFPPGPSRDGVHLPALVPGGLRQWNHLPRLHGGLDDLSHARFVWKRAIQVSGGGRLEWHVATSWGSDQPAAHWQSCTLHFRTHSPHLPPCQLIHSASKLEEKTNKTRE